MYINSNTEHIHEHLTYQKNQNKFFQQTGAKEIKGENQSKNINKKLIILASLFPDLIFPYQMNHIMRKQNS